MFEPISEVRKIAFDRSGKGPAVLLISGFPQTRMSWNKIVPLRFPRYEAIAADLPSHPRHARPALPPSVAYD